MVDFELEARRIAAKAQTLASPKMDPVDLATLLLDAGFRLDEAVIMHAIAGAESGYRTKALNVDKNHGQEDYGLYQINEIHQPDKDRVYDVRYNIELAKKIYDRQGYTAWVAYDNGTYRNFLPDARAAVDQAEALRGYYPEERNRGNEDTPPEEQVEVVPSSAPGETSVDTPDEGEVLTEAPTTEETTPNPETTPEPNTTNVSEETEDVLGETPDTPGNLLPPATEVTPGDTSSSTGVPPASF